MLIDSDLDTVKAIVQGIIAQESKNGLIRMCAWCKKIWINDSWQDVGELMTKAFVDETKITHTICSDCKDNN